jgi:hypothetical protein
MPYSIVEVEVEGLSLHSNKNIDPIKEDAIQVNMGKVGLALAASP